MSQFTKTQVENMIVVKCPIVLDASAAKDFADQSKSWMMHPSTYYVIDFDKVQQLSKDFYRAVVQFKNVLKQNEKVVCSINLSKNLLNQIKSDGLNLTFNPFPTMKEVLSMQNSGATKGSSPNVDFINPFLKGIQATFEVQCKTKVTLQRPFLKKEQMPGTAIASVLSLISTNFRGSIVLCFSEAVFLKVYENMFDEKHDKILPEMEDAAGELLNIIYGTAKTDLNTKGYSFEKALPTVLVGEKMKVRQLGSSPAVVVPCETAFGLFYVEIEFDKT